MKDDETGIDPVSTDAEGTPDAPDPRADPIIKNPPNPVNAGAVKDRDASDGDGEAGAGELFPRGSIQGKKKTSQIYPASVPRTFEFKLSGLAFDAVDGLLQPGKRLPIMVVVVPGPSKLIPQYDDGEPGDQKVIGVIERQDLRATRAEELEKLMVDERRAAVQAFAARHGIEYDPETDDPELRVVREVA